METLLADVHATYDHYLSPAGTRFPPLATVALVSTFCAHGIGLLDIPIKSYS